MEGRGVRAARNQQERGRVGPDGAPVCAARDQAPVLHELGRGEHQHVAGLAGGRCARDANEECRAGLGAPHDTFDSQRQHDEDEGHEPCKRQGLVGSILFRLVVPGATGRREAEELARASAGIEKQRAAKDGADQEELACAVCPPSAVQSCGVLRHVAEGRVGSHETAAEGIAEHRTPGTMLAPSEGNTAEPCTGEVAKRARNVNTTKN
mmetsp:Transcript_61613/g.183590  ORF Transcript_61613/g.183590 Transcript_61613/m.183590 type:complete len:209 (-) Transcript_61613:252-878(-)